MSNNPSGKTVDPGVSGDNGECKISLELGTGLPESGECEVFVGGGALRLGNI